MLKHNYYGMIALMKLTLSTFNEISALKHVITDKRFKELTNKIPPNIYSEEYGIQVLQHLQKLEPYYAHYANIIRSRHEYLSPIKRTISDDFIEDIVPYLIDVRSLESASVLQES